MSRKTIWLLATLLLFGFALRAKGLYSCLPSQTGRLSTCHFDEYITFDALGSMSPSRLDFFPGEALYWGTFQIYLQGAVLKSMELAGLFRAGDKAAFRSDLRMADRMYISGRLITVLFSVLSLAVLFLISSRVLEGRAALIPPLLLASYYVEIYMASIVKPDSIMIFFGLCSFYFCIKVLRGEAGPRDHVLAALFNGLSFSAKYTGLVFGLNYAAADVFREAKDGRVLRALPRIALYSGIAAAVFIILNPYILARTADVLPYMKGVFAKTAPSSNMLASYSEYFLQVLPASFGWPAVVLGLVSTLYCFFSPCAPEFRLAALFSSVYLLKFGHSVDLIFTYTLPVAPFFALTSACFIRERMSGRVLRWAAAALLLYTAAYSAWHKAVWSDDNTISAAGRTISGLPSGASVCVPKIEVWTPFPLRRYEPEREVLAAAPSSAPIPDALAALEKELGGCGFVLLSEYENRAIEKEPKLARLGERLSSEFEEAGIFLRPRPALLGISGSRHYMTANFMNLDMRLLKKKQGP